MLHFLTQDENTIGTRQGSNPRPSGLQSDALTTRSLGHHRTAYRVFFPNAGPFNAPLHRTVKFKPFLSPFPVFPPTAAAVYKRICGEVIRFPVVICEALG